MPWPYGGYRDAERGGESGGAARRQAGPFPPSLALTPSYRPLQVALLADRQASPRAGEEGTVLLYDD